MVICNDHSADSGTSPDKAGLRNFVLPLSCMLKACPGGFPKQGSMHHLFCEMQRDHEIFGPRDTIPKAELSIILTDAADMWRILKRF